MLSRENSIKEQFQQHPQQHSEYGLLQTKQHSEIPGKLSVEHQSDVLQLSESHRSNTEHTFSGTTDMK